MEHETLQTQATKNRTVRLELFDDGMITLFWDDIMAALQANFDTDTQTIAMMAGQIRKKQLQVVGAWVDGRVGGLVVLRQVVTGIEGKVGLFMDAFYGRGLKDEQWLEAAQQLEDIARAAGFHALCGQSTVPRVAEVAKACGYKEFQAYVKEL